MASAEAGRQGPGESVPGTPRVAVCTRRRRPISGGLLRR
jgi:hypothetical protein